MKSSELVRLVQRAGWIEIRQNGSHKIFRHPDSGETIAVPYHGSKEVHKGLANSILRAIGFR